MWPKCAFGNQKGLIRNKDMPFGSPLHHGTKNYGLLKQLIFFAFDQSKSGILGQKTGVLSVLDRGVR